MAKPDVSKTDSPAKYELNADSSQAGKGRATPTRKEREAANLRPLVSSDRKASNKASRAKMNEARDKQRIGLANGEEKFLPSKDKGPQRRYIRDYMDARWSVGELIIPVMFIVIIATSFVKNVALQQGVLFGIWGFFALFVIDSLIVGQILQKKLAAKFGEGNVQGGNRWYTAMRAFQMRPMRMPKPQVKRGKFPE